jgi:hypothetical protein
MSLPKEIFVTNEHPDQEGGWYSANLSPEDAVSGSEEKEPVNVGTYKLIEERKLELVRTVRLRQAKTKK